MLYRFRINALAVCAVVAIGLLSSFAASAQEIGLELYSFRNQIPKDVPGMLQKISAMGIREVEGGGTYGLTNEEFKKLLQKNNLRLVSYGANFDSLAKDPQAVANQAKFFGAFIRLRQ